ncbi:MAG: diguanylate cyclase [Chloroflexi bacterium]|nr:diguanylate cyclase [Chloroflexota bacterium]
MNAALQRIARWFRSDGSSDELASRLAAIVTFSEDAIIGKDLDGIITTWNAGAERLFGYRAAEAIGRSIRFLLPPDRIGEEQPLLEKIRRGEHVASFETVRLRKDGTPVPVSISISPIRDASGRIVGASKIARDITARKAAEARILRHNQELRALNAVTTAMNEHADLKTILTRALQEMVTLGGGDVAETHLCNSENELIFTAHYRLPARFVEGSQRFHFQAQQGIPGQALARRAPVFVPDIANEPAYLRRDLAAEAGFRSLLCVPLIGAQNLLGTFTLYSYQPREFAEDSRTLFMIIGRQLAAAVERARLYEQVQHLAVADSLTGISNRRHFFNLAERAVSTARRYKHPISAIMIDLDHFKQINDRYGHATGDQALRTVAEACRRHIRSVDILGRYGGEEFTILLPETNIAKARQVAERLRQSIADTPLESPQGPIRLAASVGVATSSDSKLDLLALLNHADQAMYGAKRAGGNAVVVQIV